MTNIAKSSIKILNDHFYFDQLSVFDVLVDDRDETTKFLFKLSDNQKIETVIMKFNYGYSICVSSQVGCNMGCKFCASGLLKKVRNLSTNEIVLQFLYANKYLLEHKNEAISNMVVMGIGEPFDNYDNLVNAINIIKDHYGIGLGARHITVSTCGLVNKIIPFANDLPQVNLAISLHAANDQTRDVIMPINHRYKLKELMDEIKKYIEITNRRVSFEYILLKNVNDDQKHLNDLVRLTKGLLCYVNLILYNSVDENGFEASDQAEHFIKELNKNHIICTKRLERGSKINAACGQLRAKYERQKEN